jgi:hypothetical protein
MISGNRCFVIVVKLLTLAIVAAWACQIAVMAAPRGTSNPGETIARDNVRMPGVMEIEPQPQFFELGILPMPSPTVLEILEDGGGEFRYWRSEMVLELSGKQVTMTRTLHWKTNITNLKSAVWQVSIFPFSSDLTNWDTPPGLLASGVVTEVPAPDTFAEFKIDFREFAPKEFAVQQLPSRDGTVPIFPGDLIDIEGPANSESSERPSVAERDRTAPAMRRDPSTLAPSNSEMPTLDLAKYAEISKSMMQNTLPVRYYIRIVPLGTDGARRGLPSLPIIVTGDRPKELPEGVTDALAMDGNHPDVRFISYQPLREQASDFRYHVIVTEDIPKYGDVPGWAILGYPDPTKPENLLYHKGQKLDITPPQGSKSAWEQFLDDWASTVDYFENLINTVSNTYNLIKQTIVNTIVPEDLRGPFMVALDCGLVALGIPPSIPNFSELTSMGKDYLIAQVASQAGISEELAKDAVNGIISAAEAVENGGGNPANWMKPDPDYLYKPAQFVFIISNNSDKPTDPVTLRIELKGQNHDPFLPQTLPLPSLAPGETMRIPVCLTAYIPIDAEGSHVDVWKDAYYNVGEMDVEVWTEWQQGGYFPQRHIAMDQTIPTTTPTYGKGVIPPMPHMNK